MGSCCGKDDDLKKYESLFNASQMERTANDLVITTIEQKTLTSKTQIQSIIKSPFADKQFKTVLSPPYSLFDRITTNIYLTGVGGMVSENLVPNKIKCIINATYEAPNYKVKGIQSIRVPVDDDDNEDLYIYFDDVSDKLNDVTVKKERAVVHCVAGISRSTTLVLAYLMKYKKMSLKEAFYHIRSKRSVARPKIGFFKQLISYEKQLFGQNTVNMILYEKNDIKVVVPDFYVTEFPDLLTLEIFSSKGVVFKKKKIMEEFIERSTLESKV